MGFNVVHVQDEAVSCLFDTALKLAQSCRPQDGSTAAYIFRFLLATPSFTAILRTRQLQSDIVSGGDDNDDGDDDDDCYYGCVLLLLQLLKRQLRVANVSLLQASALSFYHKYTS